MTAKQFLDTLANLGKYIFLNMPNSVAYKKTEQQMKYWTKREEKWKVFETILQLAIISAAALAFLNLPIPYAPVSAAQDKAKDVLSNLLSVDNITDTGIKILLDTLSENLEDERKLILQSIQALDDKTSFDLTALYDAVSNSTRDISNAIVTGLEQTTKTLVTSLYDKLKGVDKALAEAESKEHEVLEDLNRVTGNSVIDRYLEKFFTKVS